MADKLFLMPLDWEALLTDEKVIAMTDPAFRAYMHLLRAAWQSDIPATLPDNDNFLARVSGLGLETWTRVRSEIIVCFRVVNGRWHQKKMRQVYDEVVRRRKAQIDRTKSASEARWRVRNGERNGQHTESVTDSNQSQIEREIHTQTEIPPPPSAMGVRGCERSGAERREAEHIPECLKTVPGREAWGKWVSYSVEKNHGRPLPMHTMDSHFLTLSKMTSPDAVAAIENAIARNLREPCLPNPSAKGGGKDFGPTWR